MIEHICLTCSGWFPDKDFRLAKGKVYHKVNGREHLNNQKFHNTRRRNLTTMSDTNTRTLLEAVRDAIDAYLAEGSDETAAPAKKPAAKRTRGRTKPEPEPDTDDDADEDESDEDVEAELKKMSVADLRKRATALGFDPEDVKGAKKADLIEAIIEDMNDDGSDDDDQDDDADDADDDADEDQDDDDDDADDEGDDDEDDRRAELEGMTLPELRKLARTEPYNAKPSEVRQMDKEAIIDLMLDAEADDDSDSDMDGDPEDDSADGYTRDELDAMTKEELIEVYEEWELELPAKKVKPALIKGILAAQ